jgi:transposase-like protein
MTRIEKLRERWDKVEAVANARKTHNIAEIAQKYGISGVTVSNWTRLHALGFERAAELLAPKGRKAVRKGPKARLAQAVTLLKKLAETHIDAQLVAQVNAFVEEVTTAKPEPALA